LSVGVVWVPCVFKPCSISSSLFQGSGLPLPSEGFPKLYAYSLVPTLYLSYIFPTEGLGTSPQGG